MDDSDDDNFVETKIVEIDISPKDILIREYSGLLDELEGDDDDFDDDDDDDDYGGYAGSTAPAAATKEAGGGGGGSAFASTVFAAQSLASRVLAAKTEYDLSVKEAEEAEEAEGGEESEDDVEGDADTTSKVPDTEIAVQDEPDVGVKSSEEEEEEEEEQEEGGEVGEDVEVYADATSGFASTVFAAQNTASTGLTAQEELDLDPKAADESDEEEYEDGEGVEVYADTAFGFASTVFAAQKRASTVPAAQTKPDVNPEATEEMTPTDEVSEDVDVYGDATSGFAGTVLSGQDELDLDPEEAEGDEDGEAVEVYADTTSGFASTVFALQNLAGTGTAEGADDTDVSEVKEDVEGGADATSNFASTELATQEEPDLDRRATEEAEDDDVIEDVEVYADTTSGFASTVFALQNLGGEGTGEQNAVDDVNLKAAEGAEGEEVREDLREHAESSLNLATTGPAPQDELDLDPEVAEEAQGGDLTRDSEENYDTSPNLVSTGPAAQEEPGLDPKLLEEGGGGELDQDLGEPALSSGSPSMTGLEGQAELDLNSQEGQGGELDGDTSSNLASTGIAGQVDLESVPKVIDGTEGAELDQNLGDSANVSSNPVGTASAAQDEIDQNAKVAEEELGGGPSGDSREFAGASTNLASTGHAAQDGLGLGPKETEASQEGDLEVNLGQDGDASSNLAGAGAAEQDDNDGKVNVTATEKTAGGEINEDLGDTSHNRITSGNEVLDELDLDPEVAEETEEEYDDAEFGEGLQERADYSLDTATAGLTGQVELDLDPKVVDETERGKEIGELRDPVTTSGNLAGSEPAALAELETELSGDLAKGSELSNDQDSTGLGGNGGSRLGRSDAVKQGRKSKTSSRSDGEAKTDGLRLPKRPTGAASPRKATSTSGGKQAASDAQGVSSDPQADAWKQQVLVWFQTHAFGQSIDCDFKLRHKVANGYLVGACLAHYYPEKLDSEEFNRGNSPANKAANWEFVQKFMKRRGYGLRRQDIEILCMVPMPADSGTAAAHRLLLRLYAFLLADELVPPLPGMVPAKLRDPPARPKVPIYDRGRNEDELGDDGSGGRNGSPLRRSPYRQLGPSRRAQPVLGDVDAFNQARRRLPKDFRDTSREKNWNTNARAPASTTAYSGMAADGPAYPAHRKGGTTARTGDDATEGAGADRGDGRRAKPNAGDGGRKGVRWNTGKAPPDKNDNSAGREVCGRCGRCKDCGRRRGGGRNSGSEREDGARAIYGDRLPRNGGHSPAAARRGRYRGKTAKDSDGPGTCECDGEHDTECACHTPYARRRYRTRAGGGSMSPTQQRRRKPNLGRKHDDGTVSPLKVSSPREPSMPALSSPNAESPLGKMAGFGNGDGGWSDRVEERRQKQLLHRNRGAVRVAKVGDSGVIQPSAPVNPVPAAGQAVSPTRLRRLVNVEPTKAKAGQPSRPNAIDRNLASADNSRVSSGSFNEPATATPNTPSTTDGQEKRQGRVHDGVAAETPKQAGFNSYADYADEGSGSGADVQWG